MENEAETKELKKARDCVFRLFKIRLRSEQELVDKLKTKKFSQDTISATLRYFTDLDLIDDRTFAQKWIAYRLMRPFGGNRIRNELRQKGIDNLIIDEELKKALAEYPQEEIVLTLAKRQAAKYKNIDTLKIKQRVYSYLCRRGFNLDIINKTVKKI